MPSGDRIALLRTNPTSRVLVLLQMASVFLRLGHEVFPKARLLLVSNLVDASTLLLAPSAEMLADVHMAVARDLSNQKIDQVRRSADIINPPKEDLDMMFGRQANS